MSRGAMLFLMTGTAVVLLAGGCSTVTEVGTALGTATGTITPEQAASINRGAQAMERSFKDITPEQEHYIGRSVAATVMGSYKPYDEEAANRYLNVLGQILAQASDRPETFGGYHFQLLDSDEINAFAAPGGLIMVTRGMVRCCKSEDALSAVLAHEIGHVQGNHGLRAIRSSRLTDAFTILAVESAKNLAGQNVAELTKAFEGSIGDVTSTLMNSGYSRGLEREADQAGRTRFCQDPSGSRGPRRRSAEADQRAGGGSGRRRTAGTLQEGRRRSLSPSHAQKAPICPDRRARGRGRIDRTLAVRPAGSP
jgi:predicted Zn-dependent protease